MNEAQDPKYQCKHEDFACEVDVSRLEDTGQFMADVRIRCDQCGVPMRFIGLPAGVDLNGASVSVDACEARLVIVPRGKSFPVLEADLRTGFRVRSKQPTIEQLKVICYEIEKLRLSMDAALRAAGYLKDTPNLNQNS